MAALMSNRNVVAGLKADCQGYKYVEETIQVLPKKLEPILLVKLGYQVAGLGVFIPLNHPSTFCK